MAAEDPADIPKLTGFYKYFNSYTVKGRANIAKATYAGTALIILYYKLKPSKPSSAKK